MTQLSMTENAALLHKLRNAECRPLGFATAKDFPETRGGVYMFTTPNDESIVYIGKGSNLRRRLQWHANSISGGKQDLVRKLAILRESAEYANYPSDGRKYLVRYVVIDDRDQCKDFEAYAIAKLAPPFNAHKPNRVRLPSLSR